MRHEFFDIRHTSLAGGMYSGNGFLNIRKYLTASSRVEDLRPKGLLPVCQLVHRKQKYGQT